MSEMLLFSRFFPPKPEGQAWYWYLWTHFGELHRVALAKWQRSRRGWADCDVWSIDDWFQQVMPEMLRQLAENDIGTPMEMFPKDVRWEECPKDVDHEQPHENWRKLLLCMANDLEAHRRFWDNWEAYEGLSTEDFRVKEDKSLAEVKAGLMTFHEWFYNLWD